MAEPFMITADWLPDYPYVVRRARSDKCKMPANKILSHTHTHAHWITSHLTNVTVIKTDTIIIMSSDSVDNIFRLSQGMLMCLKPNLIIFFIGCKTRVLSSTYFFGGKTGVKEVGLYFFCNGKGVVDTARGEL